MLPDDTVDGSDSSPVANEESLLRRVHSDPSYFKGNLDFARPLMFRPNKRDDKGISLTREKFISYQDVLDRQQNQKVRLFGGILAINAGAARMAGMEPSPDPDTEPGGLPGHTLIEAINYQLWKQDEEQVEALIDLLIRIAVYRKRPVPIPPDYSPQTG